MPQLALLILSLAACIAPAIATAEDPRPDVDTRRVFSVHADALPAGASPENIWFVGHHYIASYDTATKAPTWIAYTVTAADGASRNTIDRNWIEGYEAVTLEEDDHRGRDYDIGHMLPLASFKASPYAWESNFLGVCVAQTPALNRGPWLRWEEHVRRLARSGPVSVLAGPLFEHDMPPLQSADEPHRVASHFWAIATPDDMPPQAWVFPQDCERTANLQTFAVDLAEVQRRAKLDLTYKR